jgi:hypothetical protein
LPTDAASAPEGIAPRPDTFTPMPPGDVTSWVCIARIAPPDDTVYCNVGLGRLIRAWEERGFTVSRRTTSLKADAYRRVAEWWAWR